MTLTKNSEEVKDFAALINLPPGWCWIPFEEITINYDGKRIPITSSARKPGVFPYYGASGIIDYVDDYLFDGDYLLIAEDGANLLSRSTPIAFEANGKFWVNNHAHIVQVPGELIPLSYLKEYFNFTDLRFYISGSAQPKLNQKNLNRIEIPLAPLNEQRRIVAKIEALKAHSQWVKEELEAIPVLLDQFRQSVLAAAFHGDLTADWQKKNPDVEPASVLLERIRVERRRCWEEAELEKMKAQGKTPKDDKWKEKYEEPVFTFPTDLPKLPQGWVYSRLDFIADVIDPNPKHRNPKYIQDGFSFITTAEFIEPDGINLHTNRNVAEETVVEQENRCQFTEKSIVFSRKGTIGKTRILPTNRRFALLDSLCVVNPMFGIDHNYLNLAFQSPIVCKQIDLSTRGVALKQVSVGRVRSLLIPVPSLFEQIRLVKTVKNCLKKAWHINNSMNEGCRELESLSQSILAKAFRGELVPQDPNDEPASLLLERIRAEREKLDTKKKAKGKTEKKSRKAKPEAAEPEQLSLPGFE